MSAPERMECPNCRQSIKRPALPPGAKCLCPKCNQPFAIEGGEPTKQSPLPVTSKPPALPKEAKSPSQPSPPPPAVKSTPTAETKPAAATAAAKPTAAVAEPVNKPVRESATGPKPAEFRLNCYLCGSLLYARMDQVGSSITCHDCHSVNEVKPPKPKDMQKASDGPRLDDAEDFQLSETFERPKFTSLELSPPAEPDADDSSIKPLEVKPTQAVNTAQDKAQPRADAGMVELFASHGGATSPPPPVPAPRSTAPPKPATTLPPLPRTTPVVSSAAATAPPAFSPDRLGKQFTAGVASLFPPAAESTSQPGQPRVRKHSESYGDELWSAPTDTSRPAFERGPFLVGILEFLFYPGTMPRWLALVALASIPTAVLQMTTGAVETSGTFFSGSALGLLFFAAIVGIPWLAIFGVHAMSIVSDTARGKDAIEDWPTGGFIPRGNPLFLPLAFVAALLPGLFVFAIYYLTREAATIRGPIMLLVSAMLFLPLTWLPMLLEQSPLAPFRSQTFWQSFRFSGDGWFTFYFETFILALIAAGGMALWGVNSPILAPLSAVLIVTPLFVYMRLLGRLLWYIDPDMAPPPPAATKVAPAPLPDTVDPTQVRRT